MRSHREHHRLDNTGWLRAAVLGANDGILSTAGLLVGVAATEPTSQQLVIAGIAGLSAGALSMAAGEYVSVSSQADAEKAELEVEKRELAADAKAERAELAGIYVRRGLTPELAREVAAQLSEHDALAAHARDELGITPHGAARPVQAALTSALAFAVGAALPLGVSLLAPLEHATPAIATASLLSLAGLGALAARIGGASPAYGAMRVAVWGAIAMVVTSAIGQLFGAATV